MKEQLGDAIRLCENAEASIKEHGADGLFMWYKPTLAKALGLLRRSQGNLYDSLLALKKGSPFTAESISERARRIREAKSQVIQVRAEVKESRAKNRKGAAEK
ncbi:MAG: hypothetical protein KF752_11840 [Pirellulaceae bacterium]|nr:hypothetical protein [Pirellulaceae bacterium]